MIAFLFGKDAQYLNDRVARKFISLKPTVRRIHHSDYYQISLSNFLIERLINNGVSRDSAYRKKEEYKQGQFD